jgi:hypothetical protein
VLLHILAQGFVDFYLVFSAQRLESSQHVSIQPDTDRFLYRSVKLAPDSLRPVQDLRHLSQFNHLIIPIVHAGKLGLKLTVMVIDPTLSRRGFPYRDDPDDFFMAAKSLYLIIVYTYTKGARLTLFNSICT